MAYRWASGFYSPMSLIIIAGHLWPSLGIWVLQPDVINTHRWASEAIAGHLAAKPDVTSTHRWASEAIAGHRALDVTDPIRCMARCPEIPSDV
jgi:hypothetical protein